MTMPVICQKNNINQIKSGDICVFFFRMKHPIIQSILLDVITLICVRQWKIDAEPIGLCYNCIKRQKPPFMPNSQCVFVNVINRKLY